MIKGVVCGVRVEDIEEPTIFPIAGDNYEEAETRILFNTISLLWGILHSAFFWHFTILAWSNIISIQ